jgi:branched-chain amino acid aminotransferase
MSIHRWIFHNGEIQEASQASLYAGQLGLLSGWGIFTTLRIVDNMPFAWERHWARMSRDAKLLNVEMPADPVQLENDLIRLIERNNAPNCTMRVVVVRNTRGFWEGPGTGRGSDVIALTATSKDWGESVRLTVQPNARYAASDFTRAKVLSWGHNLRWAECAAEQGFDEVILLNEHDRVAECTSANILAAFGSEVATPPLSEGCLPGVTREVLLEEIHLDGLKIVERTLTVDDLCRADEVFITSTTRGLKPVREIAGAKLPGNTAVCSRLVEAFNQYLRDDIARRSARHRAPVNA